ncbi:MAG: NAD(P)H-dependent oxidoreductase [Spirochaetaceae bacterium]|jgi:flavodoxin|nr:NAD(P)H-dependent oxidoreductase [Spirochaetaceae bacterium]
MKTLVVYYSHDGNSAFVAEQIKAALGAELLRLETADSKKRGGLSKMFWGGRMVLTHTLPELKPYHIEPEAWDLIILGAPVWAGSPAPPLMSFLAKTPLRDKRVAFFLCHAGGRGQAAEKLKQELAGNTIVGDIDFVNPNGDGGSRTVTDRITGWVRQLG